MWVMFVCLLILINFLFHYTCVGVDEKTAMTQKYVNENGFCKKENVTHQSIRKLQLILRSRWAW